MINVLVINAGSSSLKYQLIDMEGEKVIAKGLVERIGIDHSLIRHKPTGKAPVEIENRSRIMWTRWLRSSPH